MDAALVSFGATRGCAAHGNVKSSARLLCPPERRTEFEGWDTSYVHDLSPGSGTTALEPASGSREHINARAWESVWVCDEMRSAIVRQCADVSKLMYHMCIDGICSIMDLLAAFDGQMRASVSASLSGDLPVHSWWQATTGVTCGQPHHVPLPGLHHDRPPTTAEYQARTCEAFARLVSTLPTNAAQLLMGQLDEDLAWRELLWHNVLSGTEDAMQDLPSPSLKHARGITPDDGDGDDEHPLPRKRMKIQVLITACVDTARSSRAASDA